MLGDKFNLHCCFEFEYLSSVNGGRHSSRRELIVALDKPTFFVERQAQKKVVIVVTFHFVSDLSDGENNKQQKI